MQKAATMLEREGWLPVHEGVGHQGLNLAQEGVLEGVLEVLEVLEGVQEGVQGGLLEPSDSNTGVYWDYTDGIAGLWHSDFTSSDQLEYPDYTPNYPSLSGNPSYSDANIQDTPSLYPSHYSDLPATHASYYEGKLSPGSFGQILENNLQENNDLLRHRPSSEASETFGKPGPLIALLDLVGAALGSKPVRNFDLQERIADRRTANVTSTLLGKLPEMLLIGRSTHS